MILLPYALLVEQLIQNYPLNKRKVLLIKCSGPDVREFTIFFRYFDCKFILHNPFDRYVEAIPISN